MKYIYGFIYGFMYLFKFMDEQNGSDFSSADEFDDDISLLQSDDIEWRRCSSFKPHLFGFNKTIGYNLENIETKQPIDIFEHFFDCDIMEHICEQTNIYYNQNKRNPRSRMLEWKNLEIPEMFNFMAIVILMGLVKKGTLSDYWSTDLLLDTPCFRSIMSRTRFLDILSFQHFSNNCDENQDNLRKIRNMVNFLRKKFSTFYNPGKNLCIDESLMLWKGRLSFKQYIPSKRNRFGIKLFELVDCETKTILDFILYNGKKTNLTLTPSLGVSGSIVMTLLQPYLNSGHHLYIDNWYTSPTLLNRLFEMKTNACGTVRKNRKGLPKFEGKLNKGFFQSYSSSNLLAVRYKDKRDFIMLTSTHGTTMSDTGKIDRTTGQAIRKPTCIVDYNCYMSGVDETDMQISFTNIDRKSTKWYKKLFFHLMDMAIFNCYAAYKNCQLLEMSFYDFKLKLVKQLLERYAIDKPRLGRRPSDPLPQRLTARHFPDNIPQVESSKQKTRRDCIVCSSQKKRQKTFYMCLECNVPLCVTPCFKDYHTKVHYNG